MVNIPGLGHNKSGKTAIAWPNPGIFSPNLNHQNLRHTVLVQSQVSFEELATEWRLMVAQPFKAGVHWIRRLKPSATVCRHSVTRSARQPTLLNWQNLADIVFAFTAWSLPIPRPLGGSYRAVFWHSAGNCNGPVTVRRPPARPAWCWDRHRPVNRRRLSPLRPIAR